MITVQHRVSDVRAWFRALKKAGNYVTDKTGCQMLEVVGATFVADEESVFGTVNRGYVKREIEWYESQSRNVFDIPGGPPKEWVKCATPAGQVNSNYGWLIWNPDNFDQFERVQQELQSNPDSRRAVMVYTRPSIWNEYNAGGMSDFICTNAVQYFVRDGKLDSVVQMRSNDVVFGYKNDKAWQDYIHHRLASDLGYKLGTMIWHVGSLHVYSRHFQLIEDD